MARRNPGLWIAVAVGLFVVFLTWRQYPSAPQPASVVHEAHSFDESDIGSYFGLWSTPWTPYIVWKPYP